MMFGKLAQLLGNRALKGNVSNIIEGSVMAGGGKYFGKSKEQLSKIIKNNLKNLEGKRYDLGGNPEFRSLFSRDTTGKMASYRGQSYPEILTRAELTPYADDIINNLKDVRLVDNKKLAIRPGIDKYISGRSEVISPKYIYEPRVDARRYINGEQVIHTFSDIKKTPRVGARMQSRPLGLGRLDNGVSYSPIDKSLSKNNRNVNSLAPYLLGGGLAGGALAGLMASQELLNDRNLYNNWGVIQ